MRTEHRCSVCGAEYSSILTLNQHRILCNEDLRAKYEANVGRYYTRVRCTGVRDVGIITGLHGCQYYTVKCVSFDEEDYYAITFEDDAKLSTVTPIRIIDKGFADRQVRSWSTAIPEGFFAYGESH